MGKQEVYECVTSVASGDGQLPCAHMTWSASTEPRLPFAVYYLNESSGFCADNTVYSEANEWVVELYQKSSDEELEKGLQEAILRDFGPYRKSEYWVESEGCLQTAYYFNEL